MEAEDTVMNDGQIMKLAQVPPKDYGAPPSWWLRANCRVAQAQAEISFKAGIKEGIRLFAWWKDGEQYVGTCGTTLKKALEEIDGKPS